MNIILHIYILFSLISYIICNQELRRVDFNVQPGGQEHSFSDKYEDVECKFTSVSQGGTNEKWSIIFSKNGDSHFCSVERHGGGGHSYLFFQKFELSLIFHAKNYKLTAGMAFGNGRSELKLEEYKVNKDKSTVSHVDGKFKSQLTQVIAEYKQADGRTEF